MYISVSDGYYPYIKIKSIFNCTCSRYFNPVRVEFVLLRVAATFAATFWRLANTKLLIYVANVFDSQTIIIN